MLENAMQWSWLYILVLAPTHTFYQAETMKKLNNSVSVDSKLLKPH